MNILIICVNLIFCYAATTLAAASLAYLTDPAYPGKCVLKQENLILSPGENVPQAGICGIIKCGEKGLVEKYSCGVIYVPTGCKLKEPLDPVSYPDCCPTGYICNDIPRD